MMSVEQVQPVGRVEAAILQPRPDSKNVIVIRRPPPRTSHERTRMAAIRGLYPVLAGKDPGSPPRFKARLDREGGIRGLCTP